MREIIQGQWQVGKVVMGLQAGRSVDPSFLRKVDTLIDARLQGSQSLFARLLSQPGVHLGSYIAVNLPKASERQYFLTTAFPDSWVQHYLSKGYVAVDPAMKRALTSLLPFDWAEFRHLTHAQLKFFGESREFGIGERGLSIPVRSHAGEIALVSITANLSQKDWIDFKREKLGEMRMLAALLNADAIKELCDVTMPKVPVLTGREIECLRWCAEGKTFEEIADIIGISSRTVRFFLDNARRKLNCLNIVQTVVVALQRNLI